MSALRRCCVYTRNYARADASAAAPLPQVLEYCTYLKREIVHAASLRHPMIVPVREVGFHARPCPAPLRARAQLPASEAAPPRLPRQVFLTRTHLGIVMECAGGGDLLAFINDLPSRRCPEDQARWLFQQLCIGLQYCHALGVANRDLKLENLLLDGGDEGRPLLKICDFGYSKVRLCRRAGCAGARPPARPPARSIFAPLTPFASVHACMQHETNSSARSAVGTTPYMAPGQPGSLCACLAWLHACFPRRASAAPRP